jgi:GR25 family glycosyltransferase involved in LPS biosynthesis
VYSTTEAQFVEAINLRYLAQQAVGNLAGEFDVGTFVMEDVRELPGMFRESVRRLEKYWDDRSSNLWRRRGYRDMRKAQKQIANDYLAINFGLSPLVSSIRDLVDLSENWAKERHRSSVRAGTAGVVVEAIEHTQNEFTALWTLTTNWQLSAVGYAIGNQAARKFYVDAASTAWELTKFSWMVDYLYDVGTWLRASSALRYDPSIMSSVGYELKMSTTGVLSLLEARNGYNVSLSAQSQWDTTKKRRVGISTANLKPTLRNPLDLGISQAMNVVAVIKQALG